MTNEPMTQEERIYWINSFFDQHKDYFLKIVTRKDFPNHFQGIHLRCLIDRELSVTKLRKKDPYWKKSDKEISKWEMNHCPLKPPIN